MTDVRLIQLAARQHGCVSRAQLLALMSERALEHRLATGRLVRVFNAVFAVAPVLDERASRRMAATLTTPGSVLSHASAGDHLGFRPYPSAFEIISRPGTGGPERLDGILVCRSTTLAGHTTTHDGVPITTPARTLIDLAPHLDDAGIARAVRELLRLRLATTAELIAAAGSRRGAARVRAAIGRHEGLPLDRARSDAEALALVLLRAARREVPRLNHRIAGAEADLSWPRHKRIVELDGPQFHRDAGADARKQRAWQEAGWTVRRIPTGAIYDDPPALLRICP